jgi:threonylcarbamoyladenosine tRNA methylthiotransferase MtaB
MTGFEVVNFGCRLNAHEAEMIKAMGEAEGLDRTVVFNTCAVTAEAQRQARQAIRRARRADPTVRIVVTGCAAQIDPESFARLEAVDLVIGNAEKSEATTWRKLKLGLLDEERILVNDIMSVKETALHLIDGFGERARAFVQIQNGCDHRCTFCIIPFGRGPSRSVGAGIVVEQIRRLVESGVSEVVLTGVDVTSWGGDLPGRPRLGGLVRRILKLVPELPRLRLSSIDSIEVDHSLRAAIAEEPRLMPHLHLSLQAGDDLILKRMKRRHRRGDAIAFCTALRRLRPDIAFGADLIAGFPTESDRHFENSLKLIGECGLSFLHVFPYSARPSTPAARMPQVPAALIRERAARLRAAGEEALQSFLAAEIGRRRAVLVERPGFGRTEHAVGVRLADRGLPPGRIIESAIIGRSGAELQA